MIELPNEAFRYVFLCKVVMFFAFDLFMRVLGPVMISIAVGGCCADFY